MVAAGARREQLRGAFGNRHDRLVTPALFLVAAGPLARQLFLHGAADRFRGGGAEQLRERLTRQFSGMDARVAAYKSTQTFLDNQIKAWNRSDA